MKNGKETIIDPERIKNHAAINEALDNTIQKLKDRGTLLDARYADEVMRPFMLLLDDVARENTNPNLVQDIVTRTAAIMVTSFIAKAYLKTATEEQILPVAQNIMDGLAEYIMVGLNTEFKFSLHTEPAPGTPTPPQH